MSRFSAETGPTYLKSLFDRATGETTFKKVDHKLEGLMVPTVPRKLASGATGLLSYFAPTLIRGNERQNPENWAYRFPSNFVRDSVNFIATYAMTKGIVIGSALTGILDDKTGPEYGGYLLITSALGTKLIANMWTHHTLNQAESKLNDRVKPKTALS